MNDISWVLIPERLASSPDAETRRFYSHATVSQQAFAAAGFADTARQNPPLVEKFGTHRGNGGLTFPPPPRERQGS